MFRAIKRVFIWLGLMAEKATETDAINQAVVERGIRDSKVKADKMSHWEETVALCKEGKIVKVNDDVLDAVRCAWMMRRYARAVPLGSKVPDKSLRRNRIAPGADETHWGM